MDCHTCDISSKTEGSGIFLYFCMANGLFLFNSLFSTWRVYGTMLILNIILFIVGFFVFLIVNANIIVPILYSLPRAIYLFGKKQVRGRAVSVQLIAPIIWVSIFVLLGFIYPPAAKFVIYNPYLAAANWVSIMAILFKFFTTKGRAEMSSDFNDNIKKYRINNNFTSIDAA